MAEPRKCYARPHDALIIFCELPEHHTGTHQSVAHEWELDGTKYRAVDWSKRRLTVDELTSTSLRRLLNRADT